MSRSGYIEDDGDDPLAAGRWLAAVRSAVNGKRGQSALRALAAAMDAMPEKVLAAESLVNADGEFCTLGVLGQSRGMDMSKIDPEDWYAVARAFDLAPAMVREIVYENDEMTSTYEWVEVDICGPMPPPSRHYHRYGQRHSRTVRVDIDPAEVAKNRWEHMRNWVARHIKPTKQTQGGE